MPGESFQSIISLFNCMFSGLLLLATVISVICAFRAYHHQKCRAKKEGACSLAKYYAENIVDNLSEIMAVFQEANLIERLHELFPYDALIEFDLPEIMALLQDSGYSYDDLLSELTLIDPNIILKVKVQFAPTVFERNALMKAYIAKDEATGERKIINGPFLQQDFLDRVALILNQLEWFSMSCRYGIAEEEILYQSLHQTFLSSVWFLYFLISYQNESNEDKLFTNLIWLFGRWKKRLNDIQKEAEKKKNLALKKLQTAQHVAELAQIEVSAAQEKANQIKPRVHSGKRL